MRSNAEDKKGEQYTEDQSTYFQHGHRYDFRQDQFPGLDGCHHQLFQRAGLFFAHNRSGRQTDAKHHDRQRDHADHPKMDITQFRQVPGPYTVDDAGYSIARRV